MNWFTLLIPITCRVGYVKDRTQELHPRLPRLQTQVLEPSSQASAGSWIKSKNQHSDTCGGYPKRQLNPLQHNIHPNFKKIWCWSDFQFFSLLYDQLQNGGDYQLWVIIFFLWLFVNSISIKCLESQLIS